MNRKWVSIFIAIFSIIGYGVFVFASGPFAPGLTLDPVFDFPSDCSGPADTDCYVTPGWSLNGNSGTDGGTTNFIGTTDAQDFVVKTDGNEIARFGQEGNVAIGSENATYMTPLPIASGANSFALLSGIASGDFSISAGILGTEASGLGAIAFGQGNLASGDGSVTLNGENNISSGLQAVTWQQSNTASGQNSTAFGSNTTASGLASLAFGGSTTASGAASTAFGDSSIASGSISTAFGLSTIASGSLSLASGSETTARSYAESVFGVQNTDYTPASATVFNIADRLFAVGNGNGTAHNAYTMWKDGSFAYNDDNFQNDDLGTEQNMFYFNYGNHDGLGGAQAKKAIRLGSVSDDRWDINSASVGDKSISIGFAENNGGLEGSIASGLYSIAIGQNNESSGQQSFTFGNLNLTSGQMSVAIGSSSWAQAARSIVFGHNVIAFSAMETVLGTYNTDYVADDTVIFDVDDRLLVVGNGVAGVASDAFTILKNGKTGIGFDNFETTADADLLQVNGSILQTTATACTLNADADGTIICTPSDRNLKKNINDISYGLDTVNQLRPVSYEFIDPSFGTGNQIGFIAQELESIIPEVVTTGHDYKSVNYPLLTSVLAKAIQELDLKISNIEDVATMQNQTFIQSLIAWLGNTVNGLTQIHVDQQLCIGATCINESDLQAFKSWQGSQGSGSSGDTDNDGSGDTGTLDDSGGDTDGGTGDQPPGVDPGGDVVPGV